MRRAPRQYIGTIGDLSPIEYGGAIVYKDSYGNYAMTVFDPVEDDVYVYDDIILDPKELGDYDLDGALSYAGMTRSDLKGVDLGNPLALADIYMLIGSYGGYENSLNADADQMTIRQAERKYGRAVDAAQAAMRRRGKPKPFRVRKAPSMARKAYGPALPPELAVARWLAPAPKRKVAKKAAKKAAKKSSVVRIRVKAR
jgi:hypothetical protein